MKEGENLSDEAGLIIECCELRGSDGGGGRGFETRKG